MMRFGARLREAAAGLEATLRVRRRVVSELESDLEDLYAAYRAEGLPGPEARRRAERVLAPSAEVLAALAYVHRPFWIRIADRFGAAGKNRLEWGFLVVLSTAFCGLVVVLAVRAGMVPAPEPFALAIVGLGFASLLYASGRGLALHLGRVWENAGRLVDVWVLAASACGVLVIAGLGALVGLSGAALEIEANPAREVPAVLAWIRHASGLGVLGLLVAMADGLAFLAIRRRVSVLVDEARRWTDRVRIVAPDADVQRLTRTG